MQKCSIQYKGPKYNNIFILSTQCLLIQWKIISFLWTLISQGKIHENFLHKGNSLKKYYFIKKYDNYFMVKLIGKRKK
jgi:hypothetical protein